MVDGLHIDNINLSSMTFFSILVLALNCSLHHHHIFANCKCQLLITSQVRIMNMHALCFSAVTSKSDDLKMWIICLFFYCSLLLMIRFDQIYLWHVSHCRFHIPGAIWVEYNEIGHYYYNRNFNFTRSRNSRGVNNYLRSDNLYISPFCRDDNVKRCSVKCGKCQVIISEIIITSIELHWYLGGADMLPPQPRGVQNIQVTTSKYYSWEL